jgi:hypothetical protein
MEVYHTHCFSNPFLLETGCVSSPQGNFFLTQKGYEKDCKSNDKHPFLSKKKIAKAMISIPFLSKKKIAKAMTSIPFLSKKKIAKAMTRIPFF